jgi:hypothetical protein
MEKDHMKDLLARAAKDEDFAKELVSNPKQFKEEYQLSEEQLATISGAGQAAARHHGGNVPGYEGGS